MTAESIAALLVARQQAWVARDLARCAAFYADDCTVETQIAGTLKGRAALEAAEHDLVAKFPDLAIDVEETTIMGNRAVVTGTLSGTDDGGALATPGTHVSFPMVVLFTFANGQIQSERRIWDFRGFLLERVQDDLETAAKIQQILLPHGSFTRPGFEVAAASIPCRAIGGDFFDYYFDLPDGCFALTLGDIAGKGPPAALLSASLQATLSACPKGGGPAEMLAQANRAMLRRPVPARFATAVYASLTSDGRLTYSNAGHNPPLVAGRSGRRWLDKGGMVLGLFEFAAFEEETLALQPGDRLVVYSDGVTEAVNTKGQEFGEERLAACVEAIEPLAADAQVTRILETVQAFAAGTRQADDLTALVLRYRPAASE
jgi:steroid delta-isomerase-like uncharacterized protein